MPGSSTDLKLQEGDLTGACFRLNRRFQLLEGRISAIKSSSTPAAATPSGTTTVVSGGGGATATNGVTFQAVALTAASVPVSPSIPPTAGLLVVALTQDGSGGRQPAWSADFSCVPAALLDTTANTRAVFTFAASGSKWVLCAQPMEGMTP